MKYQNKSEAICAECKQNVYYNIYYHASSCINKECENFDKKLELQEYTLNGKEVFDSQG